MYTAATPNRGEGTGTWEVVSGSYAATGSPLRSGGIIYLRNLYGSNGYLDVNGAADPGQKNAGSPYDITTAWGKDRDGWCRIRSERRLRCRCRWSPGSRRVPGRCSTAGRCR